MKENLHRLCLMILMDRVSFEPRTIRIHPDHFSTCVCVTRNQLLKSVKDGNVNDIKYSSFPY